MRRETLKEKTMKIAVAGDSAGEGLAKVLADHLKDKHEVAEISRTDAGPDAFYANLSDRVASEVLAGKYERAILVCGTGIGVCISANKVPGIRAALTHDTYSAERAAKSNNAQIITMGARVIGPELAKSIVDAWLASEFDPNGPSAGNVEAINRLDVGKD
jgi:RpiB/LacA/LacB family sugar-phosphate isomerase